MFAGWKEMDAYMRENKLEGAPRSLTATKNPEEEHASLWRPQPG